MIVVALGILDLRDKYRQAALRPEFRRTTMTKYRCTVCGYVYDPEAGDPESGVTPGTSFDDLPDDWVCPECGAEKDLFEPED